MQFHKIMYPVFARMGVKLITRNMAQGGLGTVQAGMGSGSIFGDEVDLLLWDSGKVDDDDGSSGNEEGDDECKDNISFGTVLVKSQRLTPFFGYLHRDDGER